MTKDATDRKKTLFVALCMAGWEGLPTALVGMPPYLSKHAVSAIIVGLLLIYLKNFLSGIFKVRRLEGYSLLLFTTCIFVTIVSNVFLFPQPISGWLFATYSIIPILAPLAFRVAGIRVQNVLDALVFVGVAASLLLIIDQFQHLGFLEVFRRNATTDTDLRRIVFLKTETAIATTIVICRILQTMTGKMKIANLVMLMPLFYTLTVLSESRLAIGATMVSVLLYCIFTLKGGQRIIAGFFGSIAGLLALPFFGAKYINQILENSDYIATDASISWRLIELDYLYDRFLETNWLGFGIMATGPENNNILSFAVNSGGYLYDRWSYGIYIADTAIFSALLQFGPIGFALVVFMSIRMSWGLLRLGSSPKANTDLAAVGAAAAGFLISPWPINFFTLEWVAFIGNLLWFLYVQADAERREAYPEKQTGIRARPGVSYAQA